LNSISSLQKGTIVKINCEGIIDDISERKDKDGFVYFGYNPILTTFDNNMNCSIKSKNFSIEKSKIIKDTTKDKENLKIDYNIPFGANLNNTNIDESSMYIFIFKLEMLNKL
jgi:hypothetical protein